MLQNERTENLKEVLRITVIAPKRETIGEMMNALRLMSALSVLAMLAGCESVAFYSQAVSGQLEILMKRRPLDTVIGDEDTPDEVRRKLELVRELVAFARDELEIPTKGQYESYSDLNRDYVLWRVFAAPELSLEPYQWCYPIAGCVSYRGYFKEDAARECAAELAEDGYDVYVEGVVGYSTLGWFDDPVLNTFLRHCEGGLANLILHELAHLLMYVPGDTTFNESFATAVADEGLRRWFEHRDPDGLDDYRARRAQHREFLELVRRWTDVLESMYASSICNEEKRWRKAQIFAAIRDEYGRMKPEWKDEEGRRLSFGGSFDEDLSNARLVAVSEYDKWVDALQILLLDVDGDLLEFYARCGELADLEPELRRKRLESMSRRAAACSLSGSRSGP